MPPRAQPTPWHRLDQVLGSNSTASPIEKLEHIEHLRRRLDRAEAQLVRQALRQGATWALIGRLYGISRQAAWNRWGRG